jgi:hypothetical protein
MMPDRTIAELDDDMLELTWRRRRLGTTAKDQIEWDRLMAEIATLSAQQKELVDKQIDF